MTDQDFEQAPYLLSLKNVLEECNFLYDIRPNKNVKENFIFLQDNYMKKFFDFYPDFICVDILCELPKLELNLYLFTGIDANGSCEILALGFLKSDDAGIKWLCDTFIKHNQKPVDKIKVILSNKILQSNEVFQKAFSGKPILTSFFHFMQSLKKDLSFIGFNANNEKTEKVMRIFEKIFVTSCETEWSYLLRKLKRNYESFSINIRILEEIKEQLILSENFNIKLLSRSFNVFLSSIRKSFRTIICSLDTIEEVLKFCSSFIENSRREKFKNLVSTFEKPLVIFELVDYFNYSRILTPFATKLVFEQLDSSCFITEPYYVVKQNFKTSVNFCTCRFYSLLSLPCNHIFHLRRSRGFRLFDESICSTKWMKTNYKRVLIDLFKTFFDQTAVTSLHDLVNYYGMSAKGLSLVNPEDIIKLRYYMWLNLSDSWNQKLHMKFWVPPTIRMSSDSCYLLSVLKTYGTSGSFTFKTFEHLYGMSLNDILSFDDDTT